MYIFIDFLRLQYEFRYVWLSFIKTSVMMIGEFEFGGIFLGLEGVPTSPNDPEYEYAEVHRNTVGFGGPNASLLILCVITVMGPNSSKPFTM